MVMKSELADRLNLIGDRVVKIEGETRELLNRVATLIEALDSADKLPPEAVEALARVEDQLAIVDGLVEDLPAPTPEE